MKVIFYLSNHGFGHAARNIPIIELLLEDGHDVIVKTGEAQGEFVRDSLKRYKSLEVISTSMDVGLILKNSSFKIDEVALEKKVRGFMKTWPGLIRDEVKYLKQVSPHLVVCDIVPWVLCAAKKAGIKSVLISNFTWMEIYQEYLPEDIILAYKNCYQLVDKVLRYDLATPYFTHFFRDAKSVSVCARAFDGKEVQRIKAQFDKPIVFVSVGRSVDLEEEIDVSHLNYQFIVTEGIQLSGDNVLYLPKEVENTQDYIKASEMVITKAGFGTVAETMLARKKCAVIGRETVAEDRATVHHLVERALAIQVEYSGGMDMEEIIGNLQTFKPRYETNPFTNDAAKIARLLVGHGLFELSSFGSLVPLDGDDFPFEVKRVFYLVDVKQGMTRGNHAYYKSEQMLICLHGSVKVRCNETVYELNHPKVGLYLAPEVWREAFDFSEGAVLLAVSSEPFCENDYRY